MVGIGQNLLIALVGFFGLIGNSISSHYHISAPGGTPCPMDTSCYNLSHVITHSDIFLTSNTVLTFLEGTHILEQDEPVVVSGVSNLTLQGKGEMEDGFHWTVRQSNVIIKCQGSVGGFVYNESSVCIEGLTITECGASISGNVLENRFNPFNNGLYSASYNFTFYSQVNASLYFIDSYIVGFKEVSIQNCSGSCVLFINVLTIVMDEVYIAHGSPEDYNTLRCCDSLEDNIPACIGGNALFFYLDSPECNYDLNNNTSTLTVQDSMFSFGAGPPLSEAILGGITIVDLMVANLTVVFDSVVMFENTGGNLAVLTTYSDFSFNNITSAGANKYLCPIATLNIAFKISVTNELTCQPTETDGYSYTSSLVNIDKSQFYGNLAIDSAGINIDTSFVVAFSLTGAFLNVSMSNSLMFENRAALASCIGSGSVVTYPAVVNVHLTNVSISNNNFYNSRRLAYLGIPPSCVLFINTPVASFDNVTISNHNLLGIFAQTSSLYFIGETIIRNNSGTLGGGLMLRSNSDFVLFPNANVSFIDNRAERGAGIYVDQQRVQAILYRLCFYQVAGNPNSSNAVLYFSGNLATVTGDVVYGGDVDNCLLFYQSLVFPSIAYFNILFKYNNHSALRAISSDAIQLCFCDHEMPLCNASNIITSSVYPGWHVNVSVVAIGQYGGLTTGTVRVESIDSSYNEAIPANCTNILLQVHDIQNVSSFLPNDNLAVSFQLHIDTAYMLENNLSLTVVIPVMPCPPGFAVNSSFICQCVSVIEEKDANVTCNIDDESISHNGDIWIGFDTDENCTIVSLDCPFDYCHRNKVSFNILEPDPQCNFHRSGILCGECAEGHSLLLGSNKCGICPNDNYLSLLLVFGVAGIALVILLIGLNLTVSVGTINGLIFYANIVKLNENIFLANGPIPFLSQFISWINLDLGIETCFYEGMTPYAKVWLQFVFPIYIWLIIILIIIVSHYSSRVSKLVGSNAVPVLATLVLLSYVKIIRTYVLATRVSYLYCENESVEIVWSVDGNLSYWNSKHTILVAFSIFVFIFTVLPFTVFIIFVPLLERKIPQRCTSLWLRFLKPVTDAYCGPYNDKHRYWIGMGFLARLVIAVAVPLLGNNDSLLVVFFVTLFLLSLFAMFDGSYRHKILNVLEVWAYGNVLGITVVALAGQVMIGTIVSVSLILATFIVVVIGHFIWQCKKIKELCFPSSLPPSLTESKEENPKHERVMSDIANSYDEDDFVHFRESLLEYEPID